MGIINSLSTGSGNNPTVALPARPRLLRSQADCHPALAELPVPDRELILAGQRRLLQSRSEAQLPVDKRSIANLVAVETQLAKERGQ